MFIDVAAIWSSAETRLNPRRRNRRSPCFVYRSPIRGSTVEARRSACTLPSSPFVRSSICWRASSNSVWLSRFPVFDRLHWDEDGTLVELPGDSVSYVYRIPEQLLQKRR